MTKSTSTPLFHPSSKTSLSESIDSGYASNATNTPDRVVSLDVSRGEFELSSGNIFKRKITTLKVFDHEIPSHIQDRFLDLCELFEKPLYEYLIKSKVNIGSISTRLKTLGEHESSVEYWIVVLCEQKVVKRVKQFFDQSHIKSEYQPQNPSWNSPNFRIWVCNRPPRPIAGSSMVEAWGNPESEAATLCGSVIEVGDHTATLGGVIKVITLVEGPKFYAMTAGHVVVQKGAMEGDTYDGDGEEDNDDDDTGSSFDEEEFELDSALGEDDDMQNSMNNDDFAVAVPHVESKIGHSMLGQISIVENASRGNKKDLDWALLELDHLELYRPNLLVLPDGKNSFIVGDEMKEIIRRSMKIPARRTVIVMSGTHGAKWGVLSTPSSFLMAASARNFTQTYSMKLYDGSRLGVGDCGSWVIDDVTHEVYGHVVATDMFGEAYVVPLKATLEQIEEELGAESVSLPTGVEISTFLGSKAKPQQANRSKTTSENQRSMPKDASESKVQRLEQLEDYLLSSTPDLFFSMPSYPVPIRPGVSVDVPDTIDYSLPNTQNGFIMPEYNIHAPPQRVDKVDKVDKAVTSAFDRAGAETSNYVPPELIAQITQNVIKQLQSSGIEGMTPITPPHSRFSPPPPAPTYASSSRTRPLRNTAPRPNGSRLSEPFATIPTPQSGLVPTQSGTRQGSQRRERRGYDSGYSSQRSSTRLSNDTWMPRHEPDELIEVVNKHYIPDE